MADRFNPFYTGPGASAVGDSVAEGTDARIARGDHRHSREAYGTPVAVTPDGAASAGTGTDVVRANHQHGVVTYTTTPPAVAATGGAGASATAPSRGDHSHAMGILTTRGDIVTRDATTFIRRALGSNGQVLQSDGTDLVFGASPAPAFITMAKWYTD